MKHYNQAYFERWYRGKSRIESPATLRRRVSLAVGVCEWVLARGIRSVLDVGCGEGRWLAELRRIRPTVRYVGVDSSEYAARRYGRRRGIRWGSFERLHEAGLDQPFDLVVCADVLHYLPDAALRPGLATIAQLTGGLAFIEAYTADDDVAGDLTGFQRRRAGTYRRLFLEAGLLACGFHCYVPRRLATSLAALERPNGASGRAERAR